MPLLHLLMPRNLSYLHLVKNEIYIAGGAADKQVYRIFGESNINTTNVNSEMARITVFGACEVRISADNALKLKTFGESKIYYTGNPTVTKSLILGEVTIRAV